MRCVVEFVDQQSVKVSVRTTGMFDRTLYTQHPVVTDDLPISPRFSPTIFCRDAIPVLLHEHFCTAAVGYMRRTLCSKLFISRA